MQFKDLSEEQQRRHVEAIIDKLAEWVITNRVNSRLREALPPEPWEFADTEWQKIALQLYNASPRKGTGRPRVNHRQVFEGIIWYLTMPGAQWRDLPATFPSYKTCHRYYKFWKESGVLYTALDILKIVPLRDF